MRIAPKLYYYLMPRVAKICELGAVPLISGSVLSVGLMVGLKQPKEKVYGCVGIGAIGATGIIVRDVLRVYRTTPDSIEKIKLIQTAVLGLGMLVGVCAIFMSFAKARHHEKVFYTALGLVAGATALHTVMNLASHVL